MASVVYNSLKADLLKANIDFESDLFSVALVTSSYTVDIDSHNFADDITNEVAVGASGYTKTSLASLTVTQDNTGDESEWDANDIAWSSSTITARGAVVYKDTGTPSTSPLVCYIDFGSDQISSSGTFTISWNAEGILNIG